MIRRGDMAYDPHLHGPRRVVSPGFHMRVFALVASVPRGKVATYGDLAVALGHRNAARQVGFALAACPDELPWHRIVNAQGRISVRAGGSPSRRQAQRLRREGIAVDAQGRIVGFETRRVRGRFAHRE